MSARRTFFLPADLVGLRVRLCNPEGLYLAADSSGWTFSADLSRAFVFDYSADKIDEYLKSVARVRGLVLKAKPVEPTDIFETCDSCHGLIEPPNAFFDGRKFLCPQCRAGRRTRRNRH